MEDGTPYARQPLQLDAYGSLPVMVEAGPDGQARATLLPDVTDNIQPAMIAAQGGSDDKPSSPVQSKLNGYAFGRPSSLFHLCMFNVAVMLMTVPCLCIGMTAVLPQGPWWVRRMPLGRRICQDACHHCRGNLRYTAKQHASSLQMHTIAQLIWCGLSQG